MTDPIRAVVFDLDGVLVDTEPWWFEARAEVAAALGGLWSATDEAAVKGANSREWATAMAASLASGAVAERAEGARQARPVERAERVEQLEQSVVAAVVARYGREAPPAIEPGLRAARRLAGRLPLAVGSSAHPAVIDAALAVLGLAGSFEVALSSDAVGVGKPEPDVYLEVARRLGVPPAECLVVEDSLAGVRAATRAGMRVVLVPAAGHPPADGAAALATVVLDSLDALDDDRLAAIEAMPPPRPS